MANQIEKFKMYVKLLDEVYKQASCTAILDGAPELATQGANADELIIPKIDMDGLADYDRACLLYTSYIGCHSNCKEYQEYKKLKDLERQRRKSDLEYYNHKNYIFKKSGGQK